MTLQENHIMDRSSAEREAVEVLSVACSEEISSSPVLSFAAQALKKPKIDSSISASGYMETGLIFPPSNIFERLRLQPGLV